MAQNTVVTMPTQPKQAKGLSSPQFFWCSPSLYVPSLMPLPPSYHLYACRSLSPRTIARAPASVERVGPFRAQSSKAQSLSRALALLASALPPTPVSLLALGT